MVPWLLILSTRRKTIIIQPTKGTRRDNLQRNLLQDGRATHQAFTNRLDLRRTPLKLQGQNVSSLLLLMLMENDNIIQLVMPLM